MLLIESCGKCLSLLFYGLDVLGRYVSVASFIVNACETTCNFQYLHFLTPIKDAADMA